MPPHIGDGLGDGNEITAAEVTLAAKTLKVR